MTGLTSGVSAVAAGDFHACAVLLVMLATLVAFAIVLAAVEPRAGDERAV